VKNKKNKKSPQQIKSDQQHQKNLYLKRIKDMMGIIGDESAYSLLCSFEIDMLYNCRLRPVKLKSPDSPEAVVANNDLKILNDKLTALLKETMVSLGVAQPISLYDFCSYIETIYLFWRNANISDFTNAGKFKDKFPVFQEEYKKRRVEAFSKLDAALGYIPYIFNDIIEELIWLESTRFKTTDNILDTSSFYNNYIVHFEKPESILLNIDNKKRNVFRVGLSQLGCIHWMTITPMQLGRHGVLEQFPLKIYIQTHVIDRIKERLGPFFAYARYPGILRALLNKDIYSSDDGNFLIAYTYLSKKIGYLKADIFEDKLIIRTFLFITNNGTPEGKKLFKLLGVQKEDKKYLGIDKLSTFMEYDIEKDEKLKKIFDLAGCGDLFEVKKYLSNLSDTSMQSSGYLLHYLCLDNQQELGHGNGSLQP
jgi:hypothetical protein